MEINNLRATTTLTAAENAQPVASADATTRTNELKPLFDGGLKVTVAERNVLDDLQRVENAEEPTRADELSEMVREAFDFAPPEMPNFV